MSIEKFDAEYYRRYYFTPATRVAEPDYYDRVAAFVTSYLELLGCDIDFVLDAGCGAGLLHPGLRRAWPEVHIDAFDPSPWACAKYGWQQATLESFASATVYDLVICHDVVQYLDRAAADSALDKLARLSGTALLFSVMTTEDWRENCDQQLSDGEVYLRSSRWYRHRLQRHFRNAGGGLYIKREAEVVLYALECL